MRVELVQVHRGDIAPAQTARWWHSAHAAHDGPSREQLAELALRLGVPTEFDGSRNGDSIVIRFEIEPVARTMTPRSVCVFRESPVHELVAQGGVTARSVLYNDAVRALRALRADYERYLRHAELRVDDEMRLQAAHDSLAGLEYVVHRRQRDRMGAGVVTLRVLDGEIEFLKTWHTTSRRVLASVTGADPKFHDLGTNR